VPTQGTPGLLVLNGGDEFHPGNEPQDRELAAAAGRRPAYVLPTAAARQHPEKAVATATAWFAGLGLEVQELPVLRRRDAQSADLARRAAEGGLFYLVGGDPGLVARTLAGSTVWAAVAGAWSRGAALAGSSAGAMALCSHTLVMARWPHHDLRRPAPALGLVPDTVVVPHYERFGARWTLDGGEQGLVLLGLDERTAAVWDGEGWRAAGAGSVTVAAGGGVRVFGAGSRCEGIPWPRV
jgi:cyanophycinase